MHGQGVGGEFPDVVIRVILHVYAQCVHILQGRPKEKEPTNDQTIQFLFDISNVDDKKRYKLEYFLSGCCPFSEDLGGIHSQ